MNLENASDPCRLMKLKKDFLALKTIVGTIGSNKSMKLETKRYEPGDEENMSRLFSLGDVSITKNRAFWKWLYSENPLGPSIAYCARKEGDFIGHYGLLRQKYKIGDSDLIGSNSIHTFTHPDHRKRGIMGKIAEVAYKTAKEENTDISLTFPNTNSYRFYKNRLPGYHELGDLVIMVRPLALKKPYLLAKVSTLFNSIYSYIFQEKKQTGIKKIWFFDENINVFWREVSPSFKNIQRRDREFLNWKYFKDPLRQYSIYVMEKNDEMKGYIVIGSIEHKGFNIRIVVDYLAFPEDENTIASLISHGIHQCNDCDLMITLLTEGNPFYPILKKKGFLRVPRVLSSRIYDRRFFIRNNSEKNLDSLIINLDDWFITTADTEFLDH